VLRASKRILRPGGRIAFYTIFIPPDLSEQDYRRAQFAGPSAVAFRRNHQEILRSVGFVEITETNATDDYLRIARALAEARERHAEDLRKAHGEAWLSQKQEQDRIKLAAIETGLLRRSLFVAKRET
jgi:hypothetical protein